MTRVGQGVHFCTVCSTRGSWTFLICVSFLLGYLSFFFFFFSCLDQFLLSLFRYPFLLGLFLPELLLHVCVNQMAFSLVLLNPCSLAGIILLVVLQSGYFLLTCLCIQWPGQRKMLYAMCVEACPMNSSTQIRPFSKPRLALGLPSWVYAARAWAVPESRCPCKSSPDAPGFTVLLL